MDNFVFLVGLRFILRILLCEFNKFEFFSRDFFYEDYEDFNCMK